MTVAIIVSGLLIYGALIWGLKEIKIELRYRNVLMEEQNRILRDK